MKFINLLVPDYEDVSNLPMIKDNKKILNFINVANDKDSLIPNLKTIVYGYHFAEKMYGSTFNISILNQRIDINIEWISNGRDGNLSENKFSKILQDAFDEYFKYESIDIDPVFSEFDFCEFMDNLNTPLVHNGVYELYIGDWNIDGSIKIYSVKKDALKYLDVDYLDWFYDIINTKPSYVISTSEFNFFDNRVRKEPLFITDLIQSFNGNLVTYSSVFNILSQVKIPSKGQLLTFFMKNVSNISLEMMSV